jgi:aspartyl-tRNA(Asn)/glutamyl-tRNA(Gln) amidotransferase subunit A
MPDAAPLSVSDAVAALEGGLLSSRRLCETLLDRWQAVDGRLGAFVWVDPEAIRLQADAADDRRARGQARSRFDGIPIAVKDNLAATGQPCTCASRILEGYVSPYDATVVRRLREAGFVLFGRTNMDEFAMGSTTESSARGPTANPWDLTRVPGGSSGGSAAAVAAGEALAALGSDTGGSIRLPAGYCGVVGLKPSYGRVSRYGLVAYASSLDQIGSLTRTVRDAALLLDVIGGQDPLDSTSLPAPAGAFGAALDRPEVRNLRLGLPREYFEAEALAPEVRAAVEQAARTFEAMGIRLVGVSLPHLEYAIATYYIIATAEASANLARFDGIRYGRREAGDSLLETYRQTRAQGFGDEVKRRIILGTYVLSSGYYDAYYLRAQKVRTLIRADFQRAFQDCDLLLAPVAPTAAPRKGEFASPLEMYLTDIYTISANLAGICGLTVPCGLTAAGLPIGLQLLGPVLGETALLQAGHAFEATAPFTRRCPEVSRDCGGS